MHSTVAPTCKSIPGISSDHLQSAAVYGDLRTGELDARALAVGYLDAHGVHHYLLAARGLEGDPAHPRRVVQEDAVAALCLEQHLLVGWREEHGGHLGGGAPPATRPHRVVRVAVLELDPDPRTHLGQREEAGPAATERSAGHRPPGLLLSHDVGHPRLEASRHQRVFYVGDDAAVLAIEGLAHGRTTGSSAPVPSLLSLNCWV